jgi:menaquinone-specific isochorismate synthase
MSWAGRDDSEVVAGVGEAARVTARAGEHPGQLVARCRALLCQLPGARFFGGFSFDGADAWPHFGAGRFWIPRFQLELGRLHAAILSPAEAAEVCQQAEQLSEWPPALDALPAATGRNDRPDRAGWAECVRQALQLLKAEALEKIVLARQTTVAFEGLVDPVSLAAWLAEATPACYRFCFQLDPQAAFIGATPERLFRRRGSRLLSEVIAGTRPRGQSTGHDQRLAYDLLSSDKDQLEHDIVRKSIRQQLHQLVEHLEVDSHASILKLARKQHLCSLVEARLKPGVGDGDLIHRLHPTPAVGGYPTENALAEIRRLEPFNRGWYASPVGWIGEAEAEFVVAIRSGFLQGRQLQLYSGAGIVRGSEAEQEWDEIENKIGDFLHVIEPAS